MYLTDEDIRGGSTLSYGKEMGFMMAKIRPTDCTIGSRISLHFGRPAVF